MSPFYLPFERPPDPVALWTAVPRGLRGFQVNTGTLDAKPVNDDQLLTLTATLSPSFAYVFAEIHLSIFQDKAGNWGDVYQLNLQNWRQGFNGFSTTWMMPWTSGLVTPGTAVPIEKSDAPHSMDNMPKSPMWGQRNSSGILISIQAQNENSVAALEGTYSVWISFWEFDLEQTKKFPINSPLPVHSR